MLGKRRITHTLTLTEIATIIVWANSAIKKREKNLAVSSFTPPPGKQNANILAINHAREIIGKLEGLTPYDN